MCNGKILINHSSHTIALKFPSKDSPENVHQHTAIQIESNPAEERTDKKIPCGAMAARDLGHQNSIDASTLSRK